MTIANENVLRFRKKGLYEEILNILGTTQERRTEKAQYVQE